MPDLTIIIPTLCSKYLNGCIQSIHEQVHNPVQIHLSVGYHSFAIACNEAVSLIDAEWILFLNDDILVKNDFVDKMLQTADVKDADIIGAKLLYPDNTIQHAGVYFRDNGLPYHKDLRQPDREIDDCIVPAVTGACMLMRKDVFDKIGGFDEGFWNGFEDVDFCLRATQKGYSIALCGQTELIHYEKQTRGFDKEKVEANLRRLEQKWVHLQRS